MTGAQTLVILSIVYSLQEVLEFVDVGHVRRLIPEGAESEPAAVAGAVVFLGMLWLGFAALTMLLTHYGYTLSTSNDQLRVSRGLLNRREVGGALGRVQAVRIEQSFVRRVLGFVAIRVQTAAVPGQSVSRILIPFVRVGDVDRVVGRLLPGLPPFPTLVRRAARRLHARCAAPAAPDCAVVCACRDLVRAVGPAGALGVTDRGSCRIAALGGVGSHVGR